MTYYRFPESMTCVTTASSTECHFLFREVSTSSDDFLDKSFDFYLAVVPWIFIVMGVLILVASIIRAYRDYVSRSK